jgi:hypothetical protein
VRTSKLTPERTVAILRQQQSGVPIARRIYGLFAGDGGPAETGEPTRGMIAERAGSVTYSNGGMVRTTLTTHSRSKGRLRKTSLGHRWPERGGIHGRAAQTAVTVALLVI